MLEASVAQTQPVSFRAGPIDECIGSVKARSLCAVARESQREKTRTTGDVENAVCRSDTGERDESFESPLVRGLTHPCVNTRCARELLADAIEVGINHRLEATQIAQWVPMRLLAASLRRPGWLTVHFHTQNDCNDAVELCLLTCECIHEVGAPILRKRAPSTNLPLDGYFEHLERAGRGQKVGTDASRAYHRPARGPRARGSHARKQ